MVGRIWRFWRPMCGLGPPLCLPPHPPHPIGSVGHKKLPAWVQEEELFRHGRTDHDSLILTGDLGHLVVVDSSLGLVGGDTVGSCGRRGGGPMARTGTPQNSCGHGLWNGRDKVDLEFPGLRKDKAAGGSGWGPSRALRPMPQAPPHDWFASDLGMTLVFPGPWFSLSCDSEAIPCAAHPLAGVRMPLLSFLGLTCFICPMG